MAAFVWGDGGAQLTPEAIAAQRRVAQAMMARGGDYSPVQSAWQGAARLSEGLMGGLESGMADQAEQRNAAAEKELLGSFLGGGAPAAPVAAPAASPSISAPMGAAPIPAGVSDAGLSDAIAKVAAARGVDPSYMTRLAMVESGGNVNAANPNSSARGPFQFINSTAKQYGLTNPSDPAASADAAARLTLDNKAALTAALGRDPTPGELYLAHQQGAGGASKILGNPNAPIESVVGAEAARLNGAKPGMTAGQFAEKWTGKFADVGGAPAAAPAAPSGVNPKLIQAYASPYVSEGTKKVLGMMLQQQMAQTKPRDQWVDERDPNTGSYYQRNTMTGERKVIEKSDVLPQAAIDQKLQLARASKPETTVNVGGGSDKQVFDAMDESAKQARSAITGLTGLREARAALQGGAITGFGADQRLMFTKAASALGLADSDKIVNTETFRSAIAPQVAAMVKATVGSANISNSDREFAEKAAGGTITLDGKSITRLLDIMERAGSAQVEAHQKRIDAVYPDATKNPRERALFGVEVPPAAVKPDASALKKKSGLD